MKTLYFECNMGAAGDMLLSALVDLMPDNDGGELISKTKFIEQLNKVGIPGVEYTLTKNQKCGIYGSKVAVIVDGVEEFSEDYHNHDYHHDHHHDHDHHNHDHHNHDYHEHDHQHDYDHKHDCDHHGHDYYDSHHNHHGHNHSHSGLEDISDIINDLKLPSLVKMNAVAVYNLIAEAESVAHNCTIKDIHFHEVGTMDAIADVVGVCLALYRIKADKILASPIHVGCGQVKCAHGILPVPAPATAYILKDVPMYGGTIRGELCTPTGAALLKYFAEKYRNMPIMTVKNIGIGCGTKDFEQANIVRAMLGDTYEEIPNKDLSILASDKDDNRLVSSSIGESKAAILQDDTTDVIYELSCNIDDMTGEEIAFATQKLLDEGALDVYTIAIGMKKNRPGIMINCICKPEDRLKFAKLIFKYTSTLGIREKRMDRYILKRETRDIHTEQGDIRVKHSFGYGSDIEKIEYDDLKSIAIENNESVGSIKKLLIRE